MKSKRVQAFTLIELLVVITIIGILAGLLFPTLGAVRENARKTQAANDEQQIVTAMKAYFTEYGKYPATSTDNPPKDLVFGKDAANDRLIGVLRNATSTNLNATDLAALNPRQIVYVEAKIAKDKDAPKAGIGATGSAKEGQWVDPWGSPYVIFVDTSYDNVIDPAVFKDIYSASSDTTAPAPAISVAIASFGKDLVAGKVVSKSPSPTGNGNYIGSDDVVSWR